MIIIDIGNKSFTELDIDNIYVSGVYNAKVFKLPQNDKKYVSKQSSNGEDLTIKIAFFGKDFQKRAKSFRAAIMSKQIIKMQMPDLFDTIKNYHCISHDFDYSEIKNVNGLMLSISLVETVGDDVKIPQKPSNIKNTLNQKFAENMQIQKNIFSKFWNDAGFKQQYQKYFDVIQSVNNQIDNIENIYNTNKENINFLKFNFEQSLNTVNFEYERLQNIFYDITNHKQSYDMSKYDGLLDQVFLSNLLINQIVASVADIDANINTLTRTQLIRQKRNVLINENLIVNSNNADHDNMALQQSNLLLMAEYKLYIDNQIAGAKQTNQITLDKDYDLYVLINKLYKPENYQELENLLHSFKQLNNLLGREIFLLEKNTTIQYTI